MDVIDRDLTIHELEAFRESCIANLLRMSFDDITDVVNGIPAVNRWIPVEDALPEIGYSVLVTRQTESNSRYIRTASRQDDCWMDDTDKYGKPNPHHVIAWMPMPDAYEPPESEVQHD